ncbi:hypothetical protein SAMN04488054_1485 [Salibacterium qingdaonense]|uniref:Uncharacterized protein n=1 Tax=Salibacterium qingdaonense TaxID=266892 RepID=A0A1I4QR62_9BACI|nr:hypothetical protein SAMN04488054_1485 [Salibacterium qingdaonense]
MSGGVVQPLSSSGAYMLGLLLQTARVAGPRRMCGQVSART